MSLENIFTEKPKNCKHCGSEDIVKKGFDITAKGRKQKYGCRECGKIFYGLEA